MTEIPPQLVASLKELGLLESEAKIYSALVLLHDAEVKELQDFLGLSKPNIYAGLRALEGKGFIVLTNPKPTTYQAVPPEVALDMWMSTRMKAKDEALASIRRFESAKSTEKAPSNIWFVFGRKHFESKIKDMLSNARKSVSCITSSQYLDLIERMAGSNVALNLTTITDDKGVRQKVENAFKKGRAKVRFMTKDQFMKVLQPHSPGIGAEPALPRDQFDLDNFFVLLVDDAEMFYIPPLGEGPLNAISTKNPAILMNFKFLSMFRNAAGEKGE